MRALSVWLLLLAATARCMSESAGLCPTSCICGQTAISTLVDAGKEKQTFYTVNCSNQRLAAVPASIPIETGRLILNFNNLTDLFGQFPSSLPELLFLDLSGNRIKQLGRGTVFHEMANLQVLNLSHNDFRTVFNGVFRGIHKLRHLSMEHVQIRFIEEHAFDGLKQLRTLELSHNQLGAIFPEWFKDMLNLQELKMDNNHISYLNGARFESLVGLRTLSLSGNRIRGASDHAFDGLTNLTKLFLDDNQLTKVPSPSFQATENLKVLRLGGNLFAQLETGDFVGLALEEIFVENIAEMTLVDRAAFKNLLYLRTLHLHHNSKLQFVDSNAFVNVPNLRILSLHGNNLTAVSKEVVQTFQRELQISLQDNPLVCDCNIKWIHDIVRKRNSTRIKVLSAETIKCSPPSELDNQVILKNLSPSQIPDMCPPVLVGPSNSTVDKKIGDRHTFQCRAHGIPVPIIHWVLPGGEVLNRTQTTPKGNVSHINLKSPGSLEIYHISPKDSGQYVCVAENNLGEAVGMSHLAVENIDIHLFPLGVASTFVTVVWNGTARNAFPEYEIVYSRENSSVDRKSVTVSQFFRSYTINHLKPETFYDLCIGVRNKDDRQWVKLSCTRVQTRDESFLLQGVHRTSNVAVAAVLSIIAAMTCVVCMVTVAARKYRQRQYSTPEKSLVTHMSQIPMENLHSPLMAHAGS